MNSFNKNVQRNVQCIRCINRKSNSCKNNDVYLIRKECCNFIPRSFANNINFSEEGIEKLKNKILEVRIK